MASEDRDIPGVQRGVITREEAYLRRRFGREYEE